MQQVAYQNKLVSAFIILIITIIACILEMLEKPILILKVNNQHYLKSILQCQ